MIDKINQYIETWESRDYHEGIPDEVPIRLDALNKAPSYKAICRAILKNDICLESLGFSKPKSEYYSLLKQIELRERKIQSMETNIKKIDGLDPQVYSEIGPIVMSVAGRKYFDNYPVVTTQDHKWYLMHGKSGLAAFASIVCLKSTFAIRNVYIDPKAAHVQTFKTLLSEILKDFKESAYEIASSYVKIDDIKNWESLGFKTTGKGSKWFSMHLLKS